MNAIRIALVGLGKIARDQHMPAIARNDRFVLAATASRNEKGVPGIPHAKNLAELLETGVALDAVVLCTPPQVRYPLAAFALERGLHVFLEKPPGATISEIEVLGERAKSQGKTLFASWHSRFAAGVEPARTWLSAGKKLQRVSIVWHEDVRVWHPGQSWIWEAGGFGVFDPGINALSIATRILLRRLLLNDARLEFPANRATPIAAQMRLSDDAGLEVTVDLDWRKSGPPRWDIGVETDVGTLTLERGGSVLKLPSETRELQEREYPNLYVRFEELIRTGTSDVDINPLQLVSDAFLRGHRAEVEPFFD